MTRAIGLDIGGTKIAAGVVDERGALLAKIRRPTPSDDADAMVAAVIDVVARLHAEHDAAAVGIGVPGFVNAGRDGVLATPNLAWPDTSLTRAVSAATGIPAVLENDGNAAAWGEHLHGAGAGRDDLLLVAVGTGIGGGLVLDGRLHRGATGIAGEIGHLRLVPDGAACGCGARGCWEAYASGSALTRRARAAVATGEATGSLLIAMSSDRAAAIDGGMVTAAALEGDAFCRGLLAELGSSLGQGIASLLAVLDPGTVVIGGGLSDAGELVLAPLRSALRAHLTGGSARPMPRIVPAALGNDAGIVGAAVLASAAAHEAAVAAH